METEQWMACYGGPGEGFRFVGLFDNAGDAVQWCEEHVYTDPWWVFEIQTTEEFDKENA
jgi:hypothetical protein